MPRSESGLLPAAYGKIVRNALRIQRTTVRFEPGSIEVDSRTKRSLDTISENFLRRLDIFRRSVCATSRFPRKPARRIAIAILPTRARRGFPPRITGAQCPRRRCGPARRDLSAGRVDKSARPMAQPPDPKPGPPCSAHWFCRHADENRHDDLNSNHLARPRTVIRGWLRCIHE